MWGKSQNNTDFISNFNFIYNYKYNYNIFIMSLYYDFYFNIIFGYLI